MNNDDVKRILEERLEGCDIQVEGDGSHFNLVIVGALFEGLRTLRRQQLVLASLNTEIAEGAIHAVNMKTFTPEEWAAR
jgi:acid stress-induced BolA-like protein IbaG/YrbA